MAKRTRAKKSKGPALLTVRDYRRQAKATLTQKAFDYFRSGAEDERALKRNERAFSDYAVWYRVLRDVAERQLGTTVLGTPISAPLLIAPTAYHRLAHPQGELATARAAARFGTIYVASTLATTSLEDIAEASGGPRWFQLYVHRDRGLTRALVERAEASGYDALVVTVDTPLLGRRLRDERNGFSLPEGLTMPNLAPEASEGGGSMLARYVADRHDASFVWEDLAWLRAMCHLPIVLKGIVRVDDAIAAAEHGCAGVIVSNHGGRQLASAPATLDALPAIADAVGQRLEVLMDGGLRSGEDVLKALALGARAVLLGRPILWGLATDGEEGVLGVLELFRCGLDRAMALSGARTLADLDRSLVARARR